jgi:PPK2 family polyphosphate:nucleotide phosphotransferase
MAKNKFDIDDLRVRGKSFRLERVDPDETFDLEKDDARAELPRLIERLDALQAVMYAERRRALLLVFQAMDAGGKDGAIRHVLTGVNPQGVRVTSFKAPSDDELAHDYLWRVHQAAPARGMIGVFNRSHYEDVLVVRVNNLVPREVWRARYEQISRFEQHLVETGTTIVKFYLHISKDEQKRRFEERLADPQKRWKFSPGDLPVRERWDDYLAAYEDALRHCSTDAAPWYVIPANHEWARNVLVARVVVETLERLDMHYPPPPPAWETIVIPD